MIAETAFNVIQALPDKEYKRLLIMLGVEAKPKQVRSKVTGLTGNQWKEKLSKRFK